MRELTHHIDDRLGFHAQPVVRLAQECARWSSVVAVSVEGGSHEALGTDPMALLALDASCGDVLHVGVEGADEDEAAAAVAAVLEGL
ncbi:MAG: HPr family phosphocarrier protein [Atopobiaceae bacterium]|jgi:phosphotransferase system HPr (HPr) family protein|nr:HPr family phosphocarrier protein [Atopobiaceae bacterium]MCH4181277.1 HPr family phosphocarrier protein [Atopobiaceae bacterium]MCH4213797.1 HPr family phosphocarrier protein [Atopobiaceae bacterium]MCH4229792.1 HPr family phosphocarrier protein [Atopobiaceae bacterium]MCH4275740.1 HPr family phosphocarrier protein [Atopobiaceae bacterium]